MISSSQINITIIVLMFYNAQMLPSNAFLQGVFEKETAAAATSCRGCQVPLAREKSLLPLIGRSDDGVRFCYYTGGWYVCLLCM